MKEQIVYCGVDVAKAYLDAAVGSEKRRLPNDATGHRQLINWIKQIEARVQVICEPSGGYERGLIRALVGAQVKVSLVQANRVRQFARAAGILAKTEIQGKLARAGASQVLHGYDREGNLSELSFRIKTQFGEMAFRLPANVEAVEAILTRQFKSGRHRYATRAHATRVAWRIIKSWIDAQIALLQTGMVTVDQLFLPFAQNSQGQTIYETLCEKRFAGMLHDRAT